MCIRDRDGGVDRFHILSDTWLSPWTTSNWLDSNDVLKVITLENYAYVVTPSKIHRYDSTVLAFTGAITTNQANLTAFDKVFTWPLQTRESLLQTAQDPLPR